MYRKTYRSELNDAEWPAKQDYVPTRSAGDSLLSYVFFFNDTATTEIYTLSLHDALPISRHRERTGGSGETARAQIRCGACGGEVRPVELRQGRQRRSREAGPGRCGGAAEAPAGGPGGAAVGRAATGPPGEEQRDGEVTMVSAVQPGRRREPQPDARRRPAAVVNDERPPDAGLPGAGPGVEGDGEHACEQRPGG